MGFMEAVGAGYKNYFHFRGRATKEEYCYFWMFFFGFVVLGLTMDITGTGIAHQAVEQIQAMNVPAQINANEGNIPVLKSLRSEVLDMAVPVFLLFGLSIGVHLISLSAVFPMLTVHVRRLHDTGRSGWWTLLAVLGWLMAFGNLAGMLLPATVQRGTGPSNVMGIVIGLMMLSPVFVFLLQPGNRSYNKFDYGSY